MGAGFLGEKPRQKRGIYYTSPQEAKMRNKANDGMARSSWKSEMGANDKCE
ncbi:hypothetical protein PEX1_057630 [Penicillium expansum]|uniref:Uncharacterized protein n=1 Tax=Penicillium expansum TaxID=27334 RepID=A0A0A2L864_PENEN|nr:hypothetical protein PEX2_066200 [Penicillium expansum]KGO44381.1 hypothetical protein PEXP_000720 [Penicillium expansum]KGO58636.1 hypothetical protein PEX2_066200 [Penicillium expansum]KGO72800.1 hypothetical protein PEX1_057630 [Penicillium expansum]